MRQQSLRQATLCFLIKDKKVLLAMKKRGFAEGKWNGAGGKFEPNDKTIRNTAIRETYEEINVTPKSLKKMATINFYHDNNPQWNQKVTAYLVTDWEGELKETEEMAPRWFDFDKVPYEQMWDDDIIWLPKVLQGLKIKANIFLDKNQKMTKHEITII
ncbi:8-oxo-dGTP diphosphatase [Patescibacteria group bacterium]